MANSPPAKPRRFKVAFSFASEKRLFVEAVAEILAKQFGKEAILYDKYHEEEFAEVGLGIDLPKLYNRDSDLIVVVVSNDYQQKRWTMLEWRAIFALISEVDQKERVMLTRFDFAELDGLFPTDGYVELDAKEPIDLVVLILKRLKRLAIDVDEVAPSKPNRATDKLAMLPYTRSRYFTGQTGKLEQVHSMLKEQPVGLTRVVGLIGEAGIGKTELALQYCQAYEAEYEHIFWLSASDRDTLVADLARASEMVFGKNPDEDSLPNIRLIRALRMRDHLPSMSNCLVVLDNVDELEFLRAADKAASDESGTDVSLTDSLLGLRNIQVLITSCREHWGTLAQPLPLKVLSKEEGALLFLRRALNQPTAAVLEDFLKIEDREAALELSKEVDGFQLALEQAGATAATYGWSPKKYLAEFKQNFAKYIADSGERISMPHKVMYATVQTSLDLIDRAMPQAGDLVRWCAYLPPDWIPEEVFRIAEGDVFDTLKGEEFEKIALRARDQSLIHYDRDRDVYTMHRLIQRIVRLIDSGDKKGSPERYEALAVASNFADPGREYEHWAARERLVPIWRFLGDHAPESGALIRCLCNIADHGVKAWGGLGVLDEAEKCHNLATKILDPASKIRLNSGEALGSIYTSLGRKSEALKIQEEHLRICKETLGENDDITLRSKANLAKTYTIYKWHRKALKLRKEVLKVRLSGGGDRDPATLSIKNDLAKTYSELGKNDEALTLREEVLVVRREVLGTDHPDTWRSMMNLAFSYWKGKRYLEALKLEEEVLVSRRINLGALHPETLTSMNSLAVSYWEGERHQEAIELIREALAGRDQIHGPNHDKSKNSRQKLESYLAERPDLV